jgi:predicted acyl esterase
MIHGVNDNAARIPAAEWFFGGRFDRTQDKIWIGQWDHGSTNSVCRREGVTGVTQHPNCRFAQWQEALHAWFDHHLQQRDVATGPAVEAFLNDPLDNTLRGPVYTADGWSRPAAVSRLYLDARDSSLDLTPPDGTGSRAFQLSRVNGALTAGSDGPTFQSEPLAQDTVFLGLAQLSLQASLTSSQVTHIVTTLNRTDADGVSHPMGYCAIQPSLRYGVTTIAPVVPGQEMTLQPQCFTLAHYAQAGDVITLTIADNSPHHVSVGADAQMTVFTGPGHQSSVRLPYVPGASVVADTIPNPE